MGDNFLRQQVRNDKRRRDRMAGDLKKPPLFIRPELVQSSYPVHPLNGHKFVEGDTLYGVASRKGQHIDVTDGHWKLGYSDGEAAKALRDELSKPGGSGVIKMQITEVGILSGVAQARIIDSEVRQ